MHNHSHCCEHQNVKFCKTCKRPYCADCGKEWYETQYYSSYPWTYTYTYPSINIPSTGIPDNPQTTWTVSTGEAKCSHAN